MTTTPAHRAALTLGALGLGLTLTLSACGSDDRPATHRVALSNTEHDAADVAFATDMIQHHSQALSMVDTTQGRTLDPTFGKLAVSIRDAQAPEIQTMTDWLTGWGEEVPDTMRDHSAGHDMSDGMDGNNTDMPGMMSAEDMEALQKAPAADFERMWLQMMITHHVGAVEMARTEKANGRYRPAVDLATAIIASQSAETTRMRSMLGD